MNKRITLYSRNKDGVYVIPSGITVQGFVLGTEPFEYLPPEATAEEIWVAILKALLSANKRIPHPEAWGLETAWYRKAGVKTWRQFAGKADAVSVEETEGEYVFNTLEWQRGGFAGHKETMVAVPKNASKEAIVAALKKCLAN